MNWILKIKLPLQEKSQKAFKDCSPVLGTNYLKFEWFVPKTGLRAKRSVFALIILKPRKSYLFFRMPVDFARKSSAFRFLTRVFLFNTEMK